MKTQMDFYQLLIMVKYILRRMIVGLAHVELMLGDIIFLCQALFCFFCELLYFCPK